MIPTDQILIWRASAPWLDADFVEQDLVLSRALVEIFSSTAADQLALRGGTSLHKVVLDKPARYSEDIDLVYTAAQPIGTVLDGIRTHLDPWLGKPKRKFKDMLVTLTYRFQAETGAPMRLKIEINQREKKNLHGFVERHFEVSSPWFSGAADIRTYSTEELLGTKLRALYQRKKGRDLFDIWITHQQAGFDADKVVGCFRHYLAGQGLTISQAEFTQNLDAKLSDTDFDADVLPLLPDRGAAYDQEAAAAIVRDKLLTRL